jgi:hypothetical protein
MADESKLEKLWAVVREAWGLEKDSLPGRINLVGMLLGLLGSGLLSTYSAFQSLVRVFQPHYTTGVPVVQLLIVYFLFNLACVYMLVQINRR